MASTEITENPRMVHILERNGFKLYGKPWKTMENHGKPWKTMENHGKAQFTEII
ncbi:TPA: hypothetical protein ACNVDP_003410 [Klebsiella aerogenes]